MRDRAAAACCAALVVVAAAALAQPARAQQIGAVVGLTPDAYGTPPAAQPSTLELGGGVVSNELVQTVAAAAVRIRFLDDSDLRIGESSMIVLDRLVYDPDQGVRDFVLGIAVGAARFVSGDVDPERFQVQTPVALVGVRGTDFVVTVEQSGRTTVAVIDGTVIVIPNGQAPVLVEAGQSIVIEPDPDTPATILARLVIPDDPGLGPIPVSQPGGADHDDDEPGDLLRDPIPHTPAAMPPPMPPPSMPSQPHIEPGAGVKMPGPR